MERELHHPAPAERSGCEEPDQPATARIQPGPGECQRELGQRGGGKPVPHATNRFFSRRAEIGQHHREFVHARIMADQQYRTNRFGHLPQRNEQQPRAGEIQFVHRLDQRRVVPRLQQIHSFHGTGGGRNENEVGGQSKPEHRAAHRDGVAPATRAERPIPIG